MTEESHCTLQGARNANPSNSTLVFLPPQVQPTKPHPRLKPYFRRFLVDVYWLYRVSGLPKRLSIRGAKCLLASPDVQPGCL